MLNFEAIHALFKRICKVVDFCFATMPLRNALYAYLALFRVFDAVSFDMGPKIRYTNECDPNEGVEHI